MPQRTQTETRQPVRGDACLPESAPRHKWQHLREREQHSGLKNNSATAPSMLREASPPLRCVGDCCFRKTLSGQAGRSALSRAQQPPSCLRPRGSIRAVVALLPASKLTCRRTPPVATAAGQHLGSIWAATGQPPPTARIRTTPFVQGPSDLASIEPYEGSSEQQHHLAL